ncbi:hypothetical protein ACT453_21845, partial [Bacillus sp. D-CC]
MRLYSSVSRSPNKRTAYTCSQNPRQLVSLTFFAERYQSAKSSIS